MPNRLAGMSDVGQDGQAWPRRAAIFGASGGIGAALVRALAEQGVPVLAGIAHR